MRQPPSVVFELRRRDTGGLVHAYATQGAALAFVRDVIRLGGLPATQTRRRCEQLAAVLSSDG